MKTKPISLPNVTKKEFYLGLLTTPLSFPAFALSLIVMEIVARIARIFGKEKVHTVFRWESWISVTLLKIFSGAKYFYQNMDVVKNLPTDRPIILVSNHQSLYDTGIHNVILKKNRIVYVAKKELGGCIPLISFALRSQDAALIDRKNPRQSLKEIVTMGKRIEKEKRAVCIFAEGTRAKDGKLKEFKDSGIKTLLKYAPDALILPVAIDGSWKTFAYSYFPIPYGINFFIEYLPPIEAKNCNIDTITKEVHDMIDNKIKEFRGEI